MSAVRKEEVQDDILPFLKEDPEFPFEPESKMMVPPMWGKNQHSEEELRSMWDRIWRCFKSKELCRGFMFYQKVHTLDRWAYAFEYVRRMKDENFKYANYVKRVADGYEVKGTPAEIAEREAVEQERLLQMKRQGKAASAPDEHDVKSFEKRCKSVSLEDMANHPVTLRFKNRNRGDQ